MGIGLKNEKIRVYSLSDSYKEHFRKMFENYIREYMMKIYFNRSFK